ncbi:hypothetical protein BJ912DRAFT_992814 [Pholiota molesta]|nr:hypothetical protein BJ912DRAFT_992814 [Pholiota molesta]
MMSSAPANPPAAAIPNPRHICTTCTNRKAFGSDAALCAHVKAKHRPGDKSHPPPANVAHPSLGPPLTSSAGALAAHAQIIGRTINFVTQASPPVTAMSNLRHVCTICTYPPRAYTSATALRSHVQTKHTPNNQSHPPPENDAHHSPPAAPPVTAIPPDPTPNPGYVCTVCSPRKIFATADALRAHTAAKHRDGPASTPARSTWSLRRPNAPRYGYGYNYNSYAISDSEYNGLVGVDSDGDFECVGGCANDGTAMCKNCR